jgi:mono/diheme cytochrome c family protein
MTATAARRGARETRRRAALFLVLTALAGAVGGCGRDEAPDLVNGKRLFTGEGKCGSCHILARAGTGGTIGPNLDQAFLASRRAGFGEQTVEEVVLGQIDEPLNNSLMPEDLVVGQDARDVAAYVAQAAGRPGVDPGGTVPGNPLAKPGQEGKRLFNAAGCASCHALSDAGSSAAVGPSLDDVARASGGGLPPREWLRQSIVDPNAILAGGYPRNLMPDYGRRLTPGQVEALVDYLTRVGNR